MFARIVLSTAALSLFAIAGCGPAKLDESKTYTLDMGEAKAMILDAQPKPQTLTVEYECTTGEVRVGVFKDSDAKDVGTADFAKAIKSETGKKGSFTADVPENTGIRVIVDAKSKAEVKLHVTNKK